MGQWHAFCNLVCRASCGALACVQNTKNLKECAWTVRRLLETLLHHFYSGRCLEDEHPMKMLCDVNDNQVPPRADRWNNIGRGALQSSPHIVVASSLRCQEAPALSAVVLDLLPYGQAGAHGGETSSTNKYSVGSAWLSLSVLHATISGA